MCLSIVFLSVAVVRLKGEHFEICIDVVGADHAESEIAFTINGKAIEIVDGFLDRLLALTVTAFDLNLVVSAIW